MDNGMKVYGALPEWPLSIGIVELSRRLGMNISTCRMAVDVASRSFPVCEDDEGRLSRIGGGFGDIPN